MTIRVIENFRALFYAPFYAAEAIGAYAAEGVEVERLPSPSPDHAAASLVSGAADVMWGGPLRVLGAHDRDPASDLVCFADAVIRDPFFLIGRTPRPAFAMADLARLRFAVVTEVPTPWICLADDLRRAGLDPAALSPAQGGSMAQNAEALRQGRLDAVQLFQPYAEELLSSGAGHLWYAAANRGLTAYTTLVTRRPTLLARRDELQRLTRALRRALDWLAAAGRDEIAGRLAPMFPSVPGPLLAAAVTRYRGLGLYAATPVIARDGVQRLKAAMLAAGTIRRDIPWEEIVDTTVAAEACT
jgi:NitT/TauT family transport system substrate-binding protein